MIKEIKEGLIVYRNYNFEFEKILKNSKTKRQIKAKIEIFEKKLTATDENGNNAEIQIETNEYAQNFQKMAENFKKQLQKTGNCDFYCGNITIKSDKLPFLPISKINELRNNLFEKLMQERIKSYKKELQKPLKYSEFPEKIMDFRANVHNDFAKKFYKNCNCTITENSLESGILKAERPLMTTKHCLKYAFNICKRPIKLYLIDEKNQKYKLKFDCKNCQMQIFTDKNAD